MAFFLAVFDSTGEVESAFSVLARFNELNEANQNNYMKVYTDSGPIDDIVRVDKDGTYCPGALCHRVLERYRLEHGGMAKNTKKNLLPRLQRKSRLRDQGMAALKRKRKDEKETIAAADAAGGRTDPAGGQTDPEPELREAASSSKAARKTEQQVNLLKAVKKKAAERLFEFRHGAGHDVAPKLALHEKEALASREAMNRLERRSLETQTEMMPEVDGLVYVVLGEDVRETTKVKKMLARMDQLPRGRIFGRTHFLNEVVDKSLWKSGPRQFVWLCVDDNTFHQVVHPDGLFSQLAEDSEPSDATVKDVSLALCSRVLGGYVATKSWLEKAGATMSPLKPVLQLAPACRQPHQMYLSKKLHDKVKELLEALHGGLSTFAPEQLQWLLREKKTFLFLDCNYVRVGTRVGGKFEDFGG